MPISHSTLCLFCGFMEETVIVCFCLLGRMCKCTPSEHLHAVKCSRADGWTAFARPALSKTPKSAKLRKLCAYKFVQVCVQPFYCASHVGTIWINAPSLPSPPLFHLVTFTYSKPASFKWIHPPVAFSLSAFWLLSRHKEEYHQVRGSERLSAGSWAPFCCLPSAGIFTVLQSTVVRWGSQLCVSHTSFPPPFEGICTSYTAPL